MAGKKDYDFDDEFGSFDDFDNWGDAGFEGFDTKDDRNPVSKTLGGFKEGIADHFRSSQTQKRLLKKALPEGYGKAIDAVDEVKDTARSLYDSAANEIKPQLKQLGRSVQKVLPPDSKYVPKKLSEKLKEWIGEEESRELSQREQEEQNISVTLGEIFKAQAEAKESEDAKAEAEKKINEQIQNKRFKNSYEQVEAIRTGMERLVGYQDSINVSYQKKSLEIQMRHLFVSRKILEEQMKFYSKSGLQYENIVKNTALPEAVKIRNAEMIGYLTKQKIFGKPAETISDYLANFTGTIQKNITRMVNETVEGLKTGLEMANDMVSSAEAVSDMGDMGVDRYQMGGSLVGGAVAEWVGNKGAKYIRKATDRMPRVVAGSKYLSRQLRDAPAKLNEYARGTDANPFLSELMGGGYRRDDLLRRKLFSASDLDAHAQFNFKTQMAITEVIPGWLAKVHKEIVSLRTGSDEVKEQRYDYSTGQFTDVRKLSKRIQDRVFGGRRIEGMRKQIDRVVKSILVNPKSVSKATHDELKRTLAKMAFDGEIINVEKIKEDDGLYLMEKGMSVKATEEIVKAIGDKYDRPAGDILDLKYQSRLKNISDQSHSLIQSLPNIKNALLDEVKLGNLDVLKEMGYSVDRVGGSYQNWNLLFDQMLNGHPDLESGGNGPGNGPSGSRFGRKGYRGRRKGPGTVGDIGSRSARGGSGGNGQPHTRGERSSFINSGSVNDTIRSTTDLLIEAITGCCTKDELTKQSDTLANIVELMKEHSGLRSEAEGLHSNIMIGIAEILANQGKMSASLQSESLASQGDDPDRAKTIYSGLKGYFGQIGEVLDNTVTGIRRAGKPLMGGARRVGEWTNTALKFFGTSAINKFNKLTGFVQDKWAKHKDKNFDIFVEGEQGPALLAHLMAKGFYKDSITGRVIAKLSDIGTNPIVDEEGNVVLSEHQIKKGIYSRKADPIWAKAGRGLNKLKDLAIQKTTEGFNKATDLAIRVGKKAVDHLSVYSDVYVKGENEPRLLAHKLRSGGYFLRKTGEPISRYEQITGDVMDEDGNVWINSSELRDLVDSQGRPLKGISDRAIAAYEKLLKVPSFLKEKGIKLAKGMWDTAKQFGRGLKNLAFNGLRGVMGDESGMFGYGDQTETVHELRLIRGLLETKFELKASAGQASEVEIAHAIPKVRGKKAKSESDDVEEEIGDIKKEGIVERYMPTKDKEAAKSIHRGKTLFDADDDGDREGSWQDILQKRKEEEGKKEASKGGEDKAKPEKKKSGWGMLLSGLWSLMGAPFKVMKTVALAIPAILGAFKTFGGLLGNIFKAVAPIAGLLGKFLKWTGKITTGALEWGAKKLPGAISKVGTAATWASRALPWVGSAIGMIGTGIGAILTSPVALAGLAIAGTGYLLYKGYKSYTAPKTEVLQSRLVAYGIDPDEKERADMVLSLEGMVKDMTNVSKGKPASFIAGKYKIEDLMKVFNLDSSDQENVSSFGTWFGSRFKPIYLSYCTVLNNMKGNIDLSKIDSDLNNTERLQIAKAVVFPLDEKSPYVVGASPFGKDNKLDYMGKDVYKKLESLIERLTRQVKKDPKAKGEDDPDLKKNEGEKKPQPTFWERVKSDTRGITNSKVVSNLTAPFQMTYQAGKQGIAGYGQAGVLGGILEGGRAAYRVFKGDARKNKDALVKEMVAQGITDPREQAMFLAQVDHESGGFTRLEENLRYTADRLMSISATARKAGAVAVQRAVREGPQAIANLMYGNRMGNVAVDDGWKYRGRGLIMLTGKDNYIAAGKALGINLVDNPDLALDPGIAAKIALWYWKTRVQYDKTGGDMKTVTKKINGGTIGLADREKKFASYLTEAKDGKLLANAGIAKIPASEQGKDKANGPEVAKTPAPGVPPLLATASAPLTIPQPGSSAPIVDNSTPNYDNDQGAVIQRVSEKSNLERVAAIREQQSTQSVESMTNVVSLMQESVKTQKAMEMTLYELKDILNGINKNTSVLSEVSQGNNSNANENKSSNAKPAPMPTPSSSRNPKVSMSV